MRDKEGKPLVPLPPVEVTVVRVTLNDEERNLYDDIFHESYAPTVLFHDSLTDIHPLGNGGLRTSSALGQPCLCQQATYVCILVSSPWLHPYRNDVFVIDANGSQRAQHAHKASAVGSSSLVNSSKLPRGESSP